MIAVPKWFDVPVGMTLADVMRLGLIIFMQLGTVMVMGVVLSDWKGWSQESRSSKSWIIGGSLQTVITVISLTIIYRQWLEYKNKL